MVRVIKDPEERKNEIMDVAWELFNEKGYDRTTVNEIIERAGIAKGTFYYYFKSKDEVLDAVIDRGIEKEIQVLRDIVGDSGLNAMEKIKKILSENKRMHSENKALLDYLHKKENIVMHQKTLVQHVRKYAPVIVEVIKQGIEEKLFETDYPLELTEYLLVGVSFLLDPSIFPCNKEKYLARLRALQDIMEASLRAEKGSFNFLSEMAEEIYTWHYAGK